MVRKISTIVLLSPLLSIPSLLYSQNSTSGAVAGTVKDPSEAVVRGATVTLVQPATNLTQPSYSDAGGRYVFPAVAPGSYTLSFSASGFRKTIINNLQVEVTKTSIVDQTLKVGSADETIKGTAPAITQLQVTDASVGAVLSGTELNRMPILGRSAAQLIFLQPAVAPNDPQNVDGSGDVGGGQIAGARSEQVTFTVDGGDATSNLEGSNAYNSPDRESPAVSPVVPVPQDSVDAFRVITNNPNSTFGRSSGGQVSFITKSGTDNIHGALYEYHGDDGLDANSWSNDLLNITKPPSVDNRFGVSIGGPIITNKLFYYAFYEGRRFHDRAQFEKIVPTDTLKKGILQVDGVSYNLNPVNGPLAANCGAAQNLPCDPRNLGVSPVIMAQLALYPTGNDPSQNDGPTTATSNVTGFALLVATPITTDVSKLKLNYTLNSKWSAFATWQYSSTHRASTDQIDILGTPKAVSGDPYYADFYTLQVDGQINPNFLATTHGSFLRIGGVGCGPRHTHSSRARMRP
ncbi:MAG: carboxypeptidase-like regulatory domain-containing protein [Candidatus Sulfotelmatobacter sp.]